MTRPHVAIAGNVNVDMIMGPQAPWPHAGTEVLLPDYELRVGGQAANSALTFEALGVPFRLLANAGDDMLGRWLQARFGEAAAHWRLADVPTTVSVGMTHPNGERTFFTNIGHLGALGPDDILPHIPARAPEGSVALLVGAFLSPLMAKALPRLLSAFKDAGYTVALDTGWPPDGWTDAIRGRFAAWLPGIDILLLNEAETRALAATDDLAAAVAEIRAMLPDHATLVVKVGPEGAQGWRGGETCRYRSPPTVVADSIGAGDIFNAGFLAARMEGRALRECLRAGVEQASAVIATRPRTYRVGAGAAA